MQTIPNWQEIAKDYYVHANPSLDSIKFARGKNAYTELRYVHAQQVGVQAYYKSILKVARGWVSDTGARVTDVQVQMRARRMAEAQFGQMLLGVK